MHRLCCLTAVIGKEPMTYQRLAAVSLVGVLTLSSAAFGQQGNAGAPGPAKAQIKKDAKVEEITPPPTPTLLSQSGRPIDLASALQLAGVQNPEILLAR